MITSEKIAAVQPLLWRKWYALSREEDSAALTRRHQHSITVDFISQSLPLSTEDEVQAANPSAQVQGRIMNQLCARSGVGFGGNSLTRTICP